MNSLLTAAFAITDHEWRRPLEFRASTASTRGFAHPDPKAHALALAAGCESIIARTPRSSLAPTRRAWWRAAGSLM